MQGNLGMELPNVLAVNLPLMTIGKIVVSMTVPPSSAPSFLTISWQRATKSTFFSPPQLVHGNVPRKVDVYSKGETLREEFGFSEFVAKLSEFRRSTGFQEAEDADARGRIATLEEGQTNTTATLRCCRTSWNGSPQTLGALQEKSPHWGLLPLRLRSIRPSRPLLRSPARIADHFGLSGDHRRVPKEAVFYGADATATQTLWLWFWTRKGTSSAVSLRWSVNHADTRRWMTVRRVLFSRRRIRATSRRGDLHWRPKGITRQSIVVPDEVHALVIVLVILLFPITAVSFPLSTVTGTLLCVNL
jgi:hypothetical protein